MKEKLKEEISYLKFWLGVFIAISITLGSWLISNIEKYKSYKFFIGVIFILLLLFICYKFHKAIQDKIEELGGKND
jgi:membrane protein DedA with SNARE-associated domain